MDVSSLLLLLGFITAKILASLIGGVFRQAGLATECEAELEAARRIVPDAIAVPAVTAQSI